MESFNWELQVISTYGMYQGLYHTKDTAEAAATAVKSHIMKCLISDGCLEPLAVTDDMGNATYFLFPHSIQSVSVVNVESLVAHRARLRV